jgi:hypothetical protein
MICAKLWTHLQRCFMWRLILVEPTSHELKHLGEAEIHDPTLRSYVVWRRSQLLCAMLPLTSSMITYFYDHIRNLGDVINPNLNGWGNFVTNLPSIANIIILVAVVGAIGIPLGKFRVWPNWRLSSRIIRFGFIISFILPMIPAFVPLKFLVNYPLPPDSEIDFSFLDSAQFNSEVTTLTESEKVEMARQALVWRIGLSNFIKFLPALISFPASLFGAALRIKGLLPKSSLSSWILTVAGPFLSLVILTAAILLIQFSGSFLLTIGVVFLSTGPWLNVFRRGLYVKAPDEETDKLIDCNQKISLVFKLAGWILVICWAVTLSPKFDAWKFLKSVKLVLEAWGRILGSTVVFTDLLLRMTVTNWSAEKSLRTKDLDDYYESIEKAIWKKIELEDNAEWGKPIDGELGMSIGKTVIS